MIKKNTRGYILWKTSVCPLTLSHHLNLTTSFVPDCARYVFLSMKTEI